MLPHQLSEDGVSAAGRPSWIAPVRPVVPDHELLVRIGGGSYGDVWLARSVVGTWRAVKVVFRDRFLDSRPYEREFSGIQKFEPLSRSNEGFIDILQIGRNDAEGYFYYVMELADDSSAAQEIRAETYVPKTLAKALLQRGRLPVSDCLELGITLNLALTRLHEAGLIHRDIKPSNIIFVGGVPKLADIGLVIEVVEARSYVGTEGFIPPEGPNSPQADIYSLGKVLYEAGMGKDRKDFPEPLTQIAQAPDSTELLEFNSILLKACAANVQDRYQSAGEMNADLALLQSGGSVRRQRALTRRLRFVQRAVALVTVLAALIAGGWFWQSRQTRLLRKLAEEKEYQRRQAQENLYVADIRAAYADWESGQVGRMLETLQRHVPQRTEPDQRGWEWYYLLSLAHRDEKTLRGHTAGVLSVSCDPTGHRFASGSADHTVRVWDAASGRTLVELKDHDDAVACVAWSPDGTQLASGAHNGKLILWQTEPLRKLFTLDGGTELLALAWSPDGKRIAAGGVGDLPISSEREGLVTIWDARTGKRLHYLTGNVGIVRSLAWHPAGKLLVAGENFKGRMQVWNADQGQLLRTIKAHGHVVDGLAWKPDGSQLASASADQRVRIWDADRWEPIVTIDPAHAGVVTTVAWSKDGRRLITGGNDGSVKIWRAESGTLLNVIRGHQGSVRSVCSWEGHDQIVSASEDGTLKTWSPGLNQAAWTLEEATCLAWKPDERQLAVSLWNNEERQGSLQLLDAVTGHIVFTFLAREHMHTAARSLAWSPDGRRLAAGFLNGESGHLRVWDLSTRKEILNVTNSGSEPRADQGFRTVAWSPDGRLVATAGQDVRLWNVETKANVLTFPGHSNNVSSAVWSPDSRQIASLDWLGKVLIWESCNGRVSRELRCQTGFNPGHQYAVNWSSRGNKLAVAGGDGTVMVWDAVSGRELFALKGHTSTVRSVAWSPDARRLVSAAEDRTVRIWDAESGRELLVLPDPVNRYPTVTWSPSGRLLGAVDEAALIFDATLGYERGLQPQK